MISQAYKDRIASETLGFTFFNQELNPAIGEKCVFVYPDFGTPVGYPDYLLHRFSEVEVLAIGDENGERIFRVQAEDGWKGDVFASELFPLECFDTIVGED